MTLSAVLFDADGVIQQSSPGWFSAWEALINDANRTSEFLSDIFEMESPFLQGGQGFELELKKTLEKWGCADAVDKAMQIWTMIDPCEEIMNLVQSVQDAGLSVGLATNQQEYRSRYMMNELGYGEYFDHHFISCEMGVSKPSEGYFLEIISRIGLEASEILFFDDHQSNVIAARNTGINAEVFDLQDGPHRMERLLDEYGISVT
jgi:putative hydrolase of the HAD superfamily